MVQLAEEDPRLVKKKISYLLAVSALDTMDSIRNSYEEWRIPTLVLHGTADKSIDMKGSIEFVEGISSEDKKLSLYDGAVHELLNDLPRDEVLKEILDWLECHLD
jgi:alpha-beta hydrolase superfamily lysophospholipase